MTSLAAIAQIVAAIATIVLAFFTWRLARAAGDEGRAVRDQAQATGRQVAVSEAAHRAALMPWLATGSDGVGDGKALLINGRQEDAPHGVFIVMGTTGDNIRCGLTLRNIGNGVALIEKDGVHVSASRRCLQANVTAPGRPNWSAVGVGQSVHLYFTIRQTTASWIQLSLDDFTGRADGNSSGSFDVEVSYTDATGGQRVRAVFHIFQVVPGGTETPTPVPGPTDWSVVRVSYYPEDAAEPLPLAAVISSADRVL